MSEQESHRSLSYLAIIPARGGSKSIPKKNIVALGGRPLIEYSIDAGLKSRHIDRVIVSTDDQEIADVASAAGAEVPFLRPTELAEDWTPTLPVIQHLLRQLKSDAGYKPDAVVLLQPTSPFRTSMHIDDSIDLFRKSLADSLVSVVPVPHNFSPVSLMRMDDGLVVPAIEGEGNKILRRQDKPELFARNGPLILISSYSCLMEKDDLYGESTVPFVMGHRESLDIDGPEDLELAEFLFSSGLIKHQ